MAICAPGRQGPDPLTSFAMSSTTGPADPPRRAEHGITDLSQVRHPGPACSTRPQQILRRVAGAREVWVLLRVPPFSDSHPHRADQGLWRRDGYSPHARARTGALHHSSLTPPGRNPSGRFPPHQSHRTSAQVCRVRRPPQRIVSSSAPLPQNLTIVSMSWNCGNVLSRIGGVRWIGCWWRTPRLDLRGCWAATLRHNRRHSLALSTTRYFQPQSLEPGPV